MQSGSTQARLRIRESLNAHPELTIILDASGSPTSRLRGRFLANEEGSIKVQINTALGANLLVSIAGEVDTGAGRAPLLGQYRVASCRVAGIGKYHAELAPEQSAAGILAIADGLGMDGTGRLLDWDGDALQP